MIVFWRHLTIVVLACVCSSGVTLFTSGSVAAGSSQGEGESSSATTPWPPGLTPATRSTYVPPQYPLTALRDRVEAKVVLVFSVDATGRVGSVKVTGCSAPGYGFEKAAAKAVREWVYSPAVLEGGGPVEVFTTVVMDFKLRKTGT